MSNGFRKAVNAVIYYIINCDISKDMQYKLIVGFLYGTYTFADILILTKN